MSDPLATYTERLPQVKRVLHLFADRVEIAARWTLGRSYRTTVHLAELTPQFGFQSVRNRWFKRSVMIGSLAAAAAAVFGRDDYPGWIRHNALLGWGIAALCAIVAAISYRRRRFARFHRRDGRPGLDIFDAGPDRARFEAFLREVQSRIRKAG
jgi:hypothetical protein